MTNARVALRTAAVTDRVRACISILGLEPPPELDAASGVRPWYKQVRLDGDAAIDLKD